MSKRLNIILFQVDQMAASKLPCYGNEVAITPHLDRLAAEASVFSQAYCNFPLCAPSRFSMMTGRLASSIGAYDNGASLPSELPTIPYFLRHHGYQTCLSGKMHFVGADQLHGYETRLTTDIYPADFGWTGDWTEVTQKHNNDIRSFNLAGPCIRNPQMEYDEEVTHQTVKKLYDHARKDEEPFFLTVSYTHPHDPYQCHQDYWDLYEGTEIDMPAVAAIPYADQDPYSQRLLQQYGLDKANLSESQLHRARRAYYGSISYVDNQIGKVIQTLQELDLYQNTIIVFTSDHGEMLGERGLWYKKTFFEDGLRVPLLIRHPDFNPAQVSSPVSLIDLLPTLIEFSKTEDVIGDTELFESQFKLLEGETLSHLMTGTEDDQRTVYAENLAEGAMAPLLMTRKGQFKYIRSGVDPEQFFNLEQDKLELNNLAQASAGNEDFENLKHLTEARWDINQLSDVIQHSQKQRLFIKSIHDNSNRPDWDYKPANQSEAQCLRPPTTYNEWAYNQVLGLKESPD